MGLFFIQDEAKSSWRFALTADVFQFFFREHKQLRCQARATTTVNQVCSHALVKNRKLIEKHLQSIYTMAIPSNELNKVVLALSDIALCHRAGHKGLTKTCEVRHDWCKKLRSHCTLGIELNHGKTIECHAEWDQHGGSRCWMIGNSDQSTKLHDSIRLESLQPVEKDGSDQESQYDIGEHLKQQPIPSEGEQSKETVEVFDRSLADLNNSNIPIKFELPFRGQSRLSDNKWEHTSQVQLSDVHPAQYFTTPKKYRRRPELHRSDYYTLPIPETSRLDENPWAQDSLAISDASSSSSPSDVTSSPHSAYPLSSPIFDESNAKSSMQDTPPTELNETSRMWGMPSSPYFDDTQSPSLRHWKTEVTPVIDREHVSIGISHPTEVGIDEDCNLEIYDEDRASPNNYKDVSKLLFGKSDPWKNGHDPFWDAKLAVKRAQTVPIHNIKHREHEWISQRPERRRSIHELPARQAQRSAHTSDEPAVCMLRQRHRRDSLPLHLSDEAVLLRVYGADEGASAEKAELHMYDEMVALDDVYDEGNIQIIDDDEIISAGTTTHTGCIQTGSSPTKLDPSYPVFQPFQPPKNAVRELCLKMRQVIEKERVTRPGYIYCYEHRCQPGHIKIGHVHVTEAEYQQNLATGSTLLHQSLPESNSIQSVMPPRSVTKRLKQWKQSCGYEPHLLYWSAAAYGAWRIERLVHGQLAEYRERVIKCQSCRKKHIEWFQVDLQKAKNAVDMWCQFAGLQPYDCGYLRSPWRKIAFPECCFTSDMSVETLSEFLDTVGLCLESEKSAMDNGAKWG